MKQGGRNRILIFNVNWIGDVLFSTPVIRNIRLNYPDSFIACIITGRCYPVLKDNPHLDEVIIFDEKDRHRGVLAKLSFIRSLRRKGFDTVFLLHRSFSRAFLCWLAGIKERIGYNTAKRAFILTKGIKMPGKDSLHRIDFYLNIIEQAGLRVEDRYTEIFLSEEDRQAADEFLRHEGITSGDFLVVINPAGNWMPKRWPCGHWKRLADRLIKEFQARLIISGGLQDVPLARQIRQASGGKAIIACGVLNLRQFAALSKKADVFISADSGPLHIANSAGAKKIIALFGPTHPSITGPYPLKNVIILNKDIGCKVPCYEVNCPDNRCMSVIDVEDVIRRVSLLRGKQGTGAA
ncbi:MAG: lipopolysaccharide heptosyltransferase II [Candidatus Omnitrophota bacterium]